MSATAIDDVLADLVTEYERLEGILATLTDEQWDSPSLAPGWSIGAVVLHLALTEEGVVTTLAQPGAEWTERDRPLDEEVDESVRQAGLSGPQAFER